GPNFHPYVDADEMLEVRRRCEGHDQSEGIPVAAAVARVVEVLRGGGKTDAVVPGEIEPGRRRDGSRGAAPGLRNPGATGLRGKCEQHPARDQRTDDPAHATS